MEFVIPNTSRKFIINDTLWTKSGASTFCPSSSTYVFNPQPDVMIVSITNVYLPERNSGVRELEDARLSLILKACVNGDRLPPLEVCEPSKAKNYAFRVHNGYHRFCVSVALKFSHLPVTVKPYFRFETEPL